jgi:peptidyl-prolyl cis-trans isomerase C
MKKTPKSFVLLLAAVLLARSGLAAETNTSTKTAEPAKPSANAALFADNVIVKGKNVEIKRNQFDDEVVRVKARFAAQGQPLPAEHLAMLEKNVLDGLIQAQLLKAKTTDADKAAGKTVADKRIQDAKTQLGSDESLNLKLKGEGITREELMDKWAEGGAAESLIKRELKVNVTDDDVKKFYEDNPAQFEKPETVRASHILLGTRDMTTQKELSDDQKAAKRKQMEDILKRARAGEDFAKLAKEFSEDPGSKDKGGEYTFPRGQMVPEFEAAAFSLKPNQISDIVTTQFGYHIIKQGEKIPAKKDDLASVTTKIKDYLTGQALQKQFPAYIEKLKTDAGVEILDEKLKKAAADAVPAAQPSVKTEAK